MATNIASQATFTTVANNGAFIGSYIAANLVDGIKNVDVFAPSQYGWVVLNFDLASPQTLTKIILYGLESMSGQGSNWYLRYGPLGNFNANQIHITTGSTTVVNGVNALTLPTSGLTSAQSFQLYNNNAVSFNLSEMEIYNDQSTTYSTNSTADTSRIVSAQSHVKSDISRTITAQAHSEADVLRKFAVNVQAYGQTDLRRIVSAQSHSQIDVLRDISNQSHGKTDISCIVTTQSHGKADISRVLSGNIAAHGKTDVWRSVTEQCHGKTDVCRIITLQSHGQIDILRELFLLEKGQYDFARKISMQLPTINLAGLGVSR